VVWQRQPGHRDDERGDDGSATAESDSHMRLASSSNSATWRFDNSISVCNSSARA
jgi:hypothetical protein